MERVATVAEWRAATASARADQRSVGLVPTMGALHAGHRSLVERARAECDFVVVTIFVNPRQFNDVSDLAAYPRTLDADLELLDAAGADVVVTPTLDEMWPNWPGSVATTVSVRGVGDGFESEGRPGHFDGVASVVTKLFAITGPCRSYFGEKDFQQLAVVRRLSEDLALGVHVVGCPIVRDVDGLALSSRNTRLSAQGRTRALALARAVASAGASAATPRELRQRMFNELKDVEVAYADVVDPESLAVVGDDFVGPARVLVAAHVEGVRLLDNGPVNVRDDRAASH